MRGPGAALLALLLPAAGLFGGQETPLSPDGNAVDFVRDIQPIFKAHCTSCHGPEKQKARFRLDSKKIAFLGGISGRIILPGDGAGSPLVKRLLSGDKNERMPQDRDPLPPRLIAKVRAWIDQGAKWPDSASVRDAEVRLHWSFIPPVRPGLPRVRNAGWVRTPIDRFILARLEGAGLEPAPEAPKETLVRRASLDLIGLPPTPEEVDAFLRDGSPRAFEKVVDRLLDSPHYGERWARHWLDLARFAESEGFKADETRPNAWRYRDYVVRSLNADKPYDRFLREQIAGDELWPDDPEARVATAFNRHYADESNARNLLQRRQEILNDITDTVGSVFFGITMVCSRCHNHKYDMILQADYYRLQAFFANIRTADDGPYATPAEIAEHGKKRALWEKKTGTIRAEMARLVEGIRNPKVDELVKKFPDNVRSSIETPASERTSMQWLLYYKAWPYIDPASHAYVGKGFDPGRRLKGKKKERWDALKKELVKSDSLRPGRLPLSFGIRDANRTAPKTFIMKGGVYNAPAKEVHPGFPTVFDPHPAKITPPSNVESSGRRTALADWLASPENPFTSRVMTNRIWHHHFGAGIVRTPSDLGAKGERPTHPELLDWLATEFVRSGWSLKRMHRLIMTSSVYRQASAVRNDPAAKKDPENRLLRRYPRRRLEGEVIRDAALAVSGLLNRKPGGPSVFPEIPEGLQVRGGWSLSRDPGERNRRSIYIFVRRNSRYPMFETFDMPDTHESCGRRHQTTSSTQALFLLNSRVTLAWARAFAARVAKEAGPDPDARIASAYRLAYGRSPEAGEFKMVRDFLAGHRKILAGFGDLKNPDQAALVDFCHMLINSNEFVYVE